MGSTTSIQWTDATWNPTTGCSHVSDGCTHCYAEALSLRRGWSKQPWGAQHAAENVVLHPERLSAPYHWKLPRRVFVDSMSDLFHERIPDEYIAAVFGVMAATPSHTYQVLTKRPARMLAWFDWLDHVVDAAKAVFPSDGAAWRRWHCLRAAALKLTGARWLSEASEPDTWPLKNVWLGVSVEHQRRADERIPLLLQTPAAVRFLSCEPLLSPIDLSEIPAPNQCTQNALTGRNNWNGRLMPRVGWVIVGGESGSGYRQMDLDWARSLRDQSQAAGVPYFFKQVGGRTPKAGGRLLDGREWSEYPYSAPNKAGAFAREGGR